MFTIRDHGPGFDQRRRTSSHKAFHKSAEEAAVSAPGVGLGLALCERLAKELGGRLEIGNHTDGAAVRLHLPVQT